MSKWKMVKLGEVCDVRDGTHDSPKYVNEGYPLITSKNITNGIIDFDNVSYISEDEYNKINQRSFVDDGDILMPMIGTIGNPIIVKKKREFAIKNVALIKFNNNVLNRYVNYCLRSEMFEKYIKKENRGGTQKFLSLNNIRKFYIPIPPLDTQKHIADTLDKTQEIIDGQKKQLKKLDNLIKATFYNMFGDPVTNERGWDLLQLSKLGELGRGVSKHRPRNAPELLGGNYPLIQTGDVANADLYIDRFTQTYSEEGFKQSKLWKKGTLCITIAANIAKTAILEFNACFPDSIVGFNANANTNNIFIHYWFGFFQAILEAQAPESAQKNINLRILNNLKVILPPLDLQNKFAKIVTNIEEQKSLVKQSITESQNLFNGLMSKYFD